MPPKLNLHGVSEEIFIGLAFLDSTQSVERPESSRKERMASPGNVAFPRLYDLIILAAMEGIDRFKKCK